MRRKELHMPFFPVLGNHDYTGGGRRGNVAAQVWLYSKANEDWCNEIP